MLITKSKNNQKGIGNRFRYVRIWKVNIDFFESRILIDLREDISYKKETAIDFKCLTLTLKSLEE